MSEKKDDARVCPTCDGKGKTIGAVDLGLGVQELEFDCKDCNGTGTLTPKVEPRPEVKTAERIYDEHLCGKQGYCGHKKAGKCSLDDDCYFKGGIKIVDPQPSPVEGKTERGEVKVRNTLLSLLKPYFDDGKSCGNMYKVIQVIETVIFNSEQSSFERGVKAEKEKTYINLIALLNQMCDRDYCIDDTQKCSNFSAEGCNLCLFPRRELKSRIIKRFEIIKPNQPKEG